MIELEYFESDIQSGSVYYKLYTLSSNCYICYGDLSKHCKIVHTEKEGRENKGSSGLEDIEETHAQNHVDSSLSM